MATIDIYQDSGFTGDELDAIERALVLFLDGHWVARSKDTDEIRRLHPFAESALKKIEDAQ